MIAILVGAISGAIGAVVGYVLLSWWKSSTAQKVAAFIGAALAFSLGRVIVTPWLEVEYLFLRPPPELQALIDLAPDDITELKSLILESHRRGRSEEESQRIGLEWGRKHKESINFTSIFALQDDGAALRAFDDYMQVSTEIYEGDQSDCYVWFSGVGSPNDPIFATSQEGRAVFLGLLSEAARVRRTGAAIARAEPLDEALVDMVVENVVANWNSPQLDFEIIENTDPDISAEQKAKGCYTFYAFFRELQSLPVQDRLKYLRSVFGAS